jgi:hypothetical protein
MGNLLKGYLEELGRDLQGKPKLDILNFLHESGYRSGCSCVPNKVQRSVLAKSRGALLPFELKLCH